MIVDFAVAHAKARYLAILDYDDVIYPEAYRLLVKRLEDSSAGIAFGGIAVKRVDMYEDFLHPTARIQPFRGVTVSDLFRANFCPDSLFHS